MLGEDDKCAKCGVETEYLTFSIYFRPSYVKKGELFEGDWLCDNCFREETPPSYYEVEKDRNEPPSVLEEKVDGLKEIIEQNIDKVNSKLDNIQANQEEQNKVLTQHEEKLKNENIAKGQEQQRLKELEKLRNTYLNNEEIEDEDGKIEKPFYRKPNDEERKILENEEIKTKEDLMKAVSQVQKLHYEEFLRPYLLTGGGIILVTICFVLVSWWKKFKWWVKLMNWWNKPLFKWALEEEE